MRGAAAVHSLGNAEPNRIGDAGCHALAEACSRGAMPSLQRLALSYNEIGDAGLTALADACAEGALPALRYIDVDGNPASKAAQQAAENAIKNRR